MVANDNRVIHAIPVPLFGMRDLNRFRSGTRENK